MVDFLRKIRDSRLKIVELKLKRLDQLIRLSKLDATCEDEIDFLTIDLELAKIHLAQAEIDLLNAIGK